MRVTFLGTGTSHGIPVIGCACAVCTSPDPRNRRNRIGVWLHEGPPHQGQDLSERGLSSARAVPVGARTADRIVPPQAPQSVEGMSAIIDVSSEFRGAALACGLKRLDFALLTHS